MKLNKKVILRVLEHSGAPLDLKQIRHRLGINRRHQAKLEAMLRALIHKNKIERIRGAFLLAGKRSSLSPSPASPLKKIPGEQPIPSGTTGIFCKSPRGFGFVSMAKGPDVYVSPKDQNGAMDGDRVVIVLSRSRRSGKRKGKITGIVKKKPQPFLARLVRGKRMTLALPLNSHSGLSPVVILPQDDLAAARSGDWVAGISVSSPVHSKNVYGKILKVLPTQSEDELAFDLILAENQIATEFSRKAQREVEKISRRVLFHADSGRHDLRALAFVTIDGKDARDFDDAVYVEKKSSGTFRLYVSIADVAHYVRANGPIDRDAYQRGTSVYFPSHAVPMLPEILSNDLCSLRPGVNRLALTCEMEIDGGGQLLDYSIYESVIRSQARLNYDDVSAFMEGKPCGIRSKKIRESLGIMVELSELLACMRYRRGAIDFNLHDYSVEFDRKGEVSNFCKEFQSLSMRLIEQFMLQANETIALHCLRYNLPALYRVHNEPDPSKLKKMRNVFSHLGLSDKVSSYRNPDKINHFLRKLKDHPQRHQIQLMFLKSMALACYRTRNEGHFGLAVKHYTHFTSPIRRYPDLIVHRVLKSKLEADRQKIPCQRKTIPEEVAEHLSQQERNAEKAERQSFELLKAIYMERFLGERFKARVIAVDSSGLTIELPDHHIECFLSLEALHDDYYHFHESGLSLYGQNNNRLVRAGSMLQLRLISTDRIRRIIDFRLDRWLDKSVYYSQVAADSKQHAH